MCIIFLPIYVNACCEIPSYHRYTPSMPTMHSVMCVVSVCVDVGYEVKGKNGSILKFSHSIITVQCWLCSCFKILCRLHLIWSVLVIVYYDVIKKTTAIVLRDCAQIIIKTS